MRLAQVELDQLVSKGPPALLDLMVLMVRTAWLVRLVRPDLLVLVVERLAPLDQ